MISSSRFQFLFIMLSLFITQSTSKLSQADRDALVDLYQSTQGTNWHININWMRGDPCEEMWYGVNYYSFGKCSPDMDRVYELDLRGNNLNGTIPDSFSSLTTLRVLDFAGNPITGTLPEYISTFKDMVDLSLDCHFEGTLPPSYGAMQNLKSLILASNSLTGTLPSEYGNLVNVRQLFLSNKNLMGSIPSAYGNLESLVSFDMSTTNVSGPFPEFLLSLPSIQKITLRINLFSGTLPASAIVSPSLRNLYIDNNTFTGYVPEWVCDIPDYYFRNNYFSCPFPSSCSAVRAGDCTPIST